MENGEKLSDHSVATAARLLADHRQNLTTITELPADVRPEDYDDAYRIQLASHRLGGEPVALLKVGCTAEATQRIMNLDEPIGGRLGASRLHRSGSAVPIADFHHRPLIECEFAFHLGQPVRADEPPLGRVELGERVDMVAPALELVDGRFDDQLGIDGPSVVADNSMAAAVVIGEPVAINQVDDLSSVPVRLTIGTRGGSDGAADAGSIMARGSGAEVLGDPWRSLLWAVTHEQRLDRSVEAGTWVITGSCAGAPPVVLDQPMVADFTGLGAVSVTVTA